MLLTSLKCKYIGALAVYVSCRTYDASRKFAEVILCAGKEAYVRAAVAERNTERLRISADDVCSPLARCLDDSKGRWVRIYHKKALLRVYRISKACKVFDDTVFVDTWNKHTGNIAGSDFSEHRAI